MKTKVIRITSPDYERMNHMKGYLSYTRFVTTLLDKEEQPRKPNPQIKKPPTSPHFAPIKELYFNKFKENNGFEYTDWSGVQAKSLNQLIVKLTKINESDAPITDIFKVLMDKLPTFYKSHNLSSINKNLNAIIGTIKNGGDKGKIIQDGGKFDFRN